LSTVDPLGGRQWQLAGFGEMLKPRLELGLRERLPAGNRDVQFDAPNMVGSRQHPPKSRLQNTVKPTEPEDDTPLSLGDDPKREDDRYRGHEEEEEEDQCDRQ